MRSFFLLALLSGASFGQSLVVSNRGDNSIQVFDVAERKSVGVYDVGVGAHEFAVSPDGRTIVGGCYGSGPMHKVADQRLVVFDLDDPTKPILVDLGGNPRPNDLAFAGSERLIVTSEVKERVLVLSTESWKIEREIPIDVPGGHMLALSPDGKRAYVPSVHTGKVALVDLDTDEPTDLRTQVMVERGAEGVALSPSGDALWVACHQPGIIGVVDPHTLQVVERIEADGAPFRVCFTPDGTRVVVAHPMANEIRIYSAEKRALLHSVAIENGAPTSITVSSDGQHAFAVCTRLKKIAMVDLESAEVIHLFSTGAEPDAIAVSDHVPGLK